MFDVGGEFAFGESFECLESGSSNLFVRIMFESMHIDASIDRITANERQKALSSALYWVSSSATRSSRFCR